MLIAAGTFTLVVALIYGIYWAILIRPDDQAQADLRKRLKGDRKKIVDSIALVKNVEQYSHLPFLNKMLADAMGTFGPLQRTLTESGVELSLGLFCLISAFTGMLTFVVVTSFRM